ncbi:MAG: hypothetical protein ED555_11795 [Allomuricauda sp.]|nr:MAG: hypothetical protein ED555_11795 [Allomuricauda sp.]
MKKLFWILLIFSFFLYSIYDMYQGISEISREEVGLLHAFSKIIVPLYIMGCSIYLFYIKLIKK